MGVFLHAIGASPRPPPTRAGDALLQQRRQRDRRDPDMAADLRDAVAPAYHQSMSAVETIALFTVLLAGAYLLALGAASLIVPAKATRFLLGFASSPRVHYAEMAVRFAVGAALVLHAPRMYLSGAFSLLGWVLLITTSCLILMPWRWHQRFARRTVPRAARRITLIGVASLALGGLVLAAVVRGGAA